MPPTTPIAGFRALFGRDPVTGEVYQVGSSSEVESINDLIDVDTGTTGPTGGQVLVWDETLSQWVPGSQANALNDLSDVTTSATGTTGPTGPSDGQVLLWDATLQQWVPGSQASSIDDLTDVDTSTTGPTGGDGLVWDDTVSQWVPGSPVSTLDGLTDVDTSTTGPVDKDALVWNEAVGQWIPGARSIDDLADVSVNGGPTGPSGPTHGAVLVWDETQALWVPGPGASEVEAGPTMPSGTGWELWMDTAIPVIPPGGAVDTSDFLLRTGGEMSGGITFAGQEGITFNNQDSGLAFPGGSSIVENVATSTLLIRRSTAGTRPQIGNVDGSATYNIVDARPSTEVVTDGAYPWFPNSDIKLRYNDVMCTWYGRVVVDMPAPAPTCTVAGWPAGIGFPGRVTAPIDVAQGSGTNLQFYEAAQVYLDPIGLCVMCYTGFTLPNGRSFDFSITWAR